MITERDVIDLEGDELHDIVEGPVERGWRVSGERVLGIPSLSAWRREPDGRTVHVAVDGHVGDDTRGVVARLSALLDRADAVAG